jgi:glyoxylate reductase
MAKIFVTRPIPGSAIETLRTKGHEVVVNPENRVLSKKELIENIKNGYEGVVTQLQDKVDPEVMDSAPNIKIYSNYAVGFNNIDVKEAEKRGIVVTNTPCESVNEAVAEHTMAMILALTTRIFEGDRLIRGGKYSGFDPNLLLGEDLKGLILGVIGAGHIGQSVIRTAVQGFRMKSLYFDIKRNEIAEKEYGARFALSIEDLLKEADIVSLHVFLSPQTMHLLNKERFEIMKKGSYVVNTARGPVIDEKALVSALHSGKLAGAALDVFENEPQIEPELLKMDNVILTPHIASATNLCRNEMSALVAQNIIEFFEGKMPQYSVRSVI